MATSETSFADRHQRGQTMHNAIDGFAPAFVPQDPNLAAGAFQSYLNGVEQKNDEVSDAESILTPLTDERVTAAEALKDKALRVKDHVSANVVWKKHFKAISAAADDVRGYSLPKKVVPPPAGALPPVPKKPRQGARSQQGFADLEKLFGKLIAQVNKVTGYAATAGSGLMITELTAQDAAFTLLNDNVSEAEETLSEAQRVRKDFYDGENGLREKMKCIKKAVRAQYGSASPQYAAVSGITL